LSFPSTGKELKQKPKVLLASPERSLVSALVLSRRSGRKIPANRFGGCGLSCGRRNIMADKFVVETDPEKIKKDAECERRWMHRQIESVLQDTDMMMFYFNRDRNYAGQDFIRRQKKEAALLLAVLDQQWTPNPRINRVEDPYPCSEYPGD